MTFRRSACIAGLATSIALPGCDRELPPRGQILLTMDTDAPLAPMRGDKTPLFDRVSVAIFPPGANVPCDGCTRELPADGEKVRGLAFSFGIVLPPRTVGYRVRLRLFRSAGRAEPRPSSTIELVGFLPAVAEEGISEITAVFRTDDVGKPTGTLDAPVIFDRGRPGVSREGTWSAASPVDCAPGDHPSAVCVPGGAFFMGDPRVTVDAASGGAREHLVVLSPFWLDRREVTVGDVRLSNLASIDSRGRAVDPRDDSNEGTLGVCDYTRVPGANEELPVDCVSFALATRFCRARGGDLPTDAQFEFVASRKGTTLAPWGDAVTGCGEVVAARGVDRDAGGCNDDPFRLGGLLPEKAGSGTLDRVELPRGVVVDLGANLSEWTRDVFQNDDGACWASVRLQDPTCMGEGSLRTRRGGSFGDPVVPYVQLRRSEVAASQPAAVGFRCAYPAP